MEERVGFLKIYRTLLDWEWYDDANTLRLFLHLLLLSNYKTKTWRGIEIERGSILTSVENLALSLKLSVKQIRTSLDKLKSTKELAIKTTNKYSLITIINYNTYQDCNIENGKQEDNRVANEGQTDGKQRATTKEYKEIKKEENNIFPEIEKKNIEESDSMFEIFWNNYDKKTEKNNSIKEWKKLTMEEKELAVNHSLLYSQSREKQFRKDPNRYLRDKIFNDEIIKPNPISRLPNIQKTQGNFQITKETKMDYTRGWD